MSARRRYWDERPWASAVRDSVDLVAKHKPPPEAGKVGALFAVAYAVLDVSDSIRYHADTTHRKADR